MASITSLYRLDPSVLLGDTTRSSSRTQDVSLWRKLFGFKEARDTDRTEKTDRSFIARPRPAFLEPSTPAPDTAAEDLCPSPERTLHEEPAQALPVCPEVEETFEPQAKTPVVLSASDDSDDAFRDGGIGLLIAEGALSTDEVSIQGA